MNAGSLDHRNIGSHVTLHVKGGTISGALAIVAQSDDETTIILAHNEEDQLIFKNSTLVEVSLPPHAAYTLALKNTVEDLLDRLEKNA